MSSFPCLVRFVSGSGQVRYRLGDRLVDRYQEFVADRCRRGRPQADGPFPDYYTRLAKMEADADGTAQGE